MPIVTATVVVGGALVVASHVPAGEGLEQRPTTRPPGDEPTWRWPVAIWQGRRPQISSGWGTPRDGGKRSHRGADVAFWRAAGELTQYREGTKEATKSFVMPNGTEVLAMADGEVWSVGPSPKGIMVVISHGKPYATFYQHLTSCRWPARKGAAGGPKVRAGQPIGVVGNDPTVGPNSFNHPHVEFWIGGAAESARDPKPYLDRAYHGVAVAW